jgi:hypothetical protein
MHVIMKMRKSGITAGKREFNIMSSEIKERKWDKGKKVEW